MSRWAETKRFLREKGVYKRHMLQSWGGSVFGNMPPWKFAKLVNVNGADGYRATLGNYKRIFE